MQRNRITIFAGHYGSGKTTVALNYAVWLKKKCSNVVICDLDIVNPYFRTLDGLDFMNEHGVGIISSQYANTNVDLPSIPPQAQSVFDDKSIFAVLDVGGDDRGALALGRYSRYINDERDYEMLLVLNRYRPLTRDMTGLAVIKEEIEKAAGVRFTGIVNNSNLGVETTFADVTDSYGFANEAGGALGLPIKMTSVKYDIIEADGSVGNIFPLEITNKSIWKI